MNSGDCVLCLVEADHLDFVILGPHQGHNLAWSPHKRLAVAVEFYLAVWVNMPDHSTILCVEQHPIAETPLAVHPTQDGDVVGIDLRDDGDSPRREAWDLDQNPGLCSQP